MSKKHFCWKLGTAQLALPALLASSIAMAPASAQAGFFEQLFGIQSAPQAQPPAEYLGPVPDFAPRRRHRAPRPRVVSEVGSGKQTPTDLMHDKTLRQGDAVMMETGVRIYRGARGDTHTAGEFVPLDKSGLPRTARTTLASVDAREVAAAATGTDGVLGSGRSVAIDGLAVVSGTAIVDARGRRVRYVGP